VNGSTSDDFVAVIPACSSHRLEGAIQNTVRYVRLIQNSNSSHLRRTLQLQMHRFVLMSLPRVQSKR
jgi:hypothetical protein